MLPLIDISEILTIDDTSFVSDQKYTYRPLNSLIAKLTEISIGADSNFKADGKVKITIGGRAITSQNSQVQSTKLIDNLTFRFSDNDLSALQNGEALEIEFAKGTANGAVQVSLTGMLYTVDEFKALKKKLGFE